MPTGQESPTVFLHISFPKSYHCALPPCLELNFPLNTLASETHSIMSHFLGFPALSSWNFVNQADALNLDPRSMASYPRLWLMLSSASRIPSPWFCSFSHALSKPLLISYLLLWEHTWAQASDPPSICWAYRQVLDTLFLLCPFLRAASRPTLQSCWGKAAGWHRAGLRTAAGPSASANAFLPACALGVRNASWCVTSEWYIIKI